MNASEKALNLKPDVAPLDTDASNIDVGEAVPIPTLLLSNTTKLADALLFSILNAVVADVAPEPRTCSIDVANVPSTPDLMLTPFWVADNIEEPAPYKIVELPPPDFIAIIILLPYLR